ncbi:hypothetical protein [Phyllobacterium calauticae]|uniref:hypothetical protein n=1 Tax=Phyllobacterium calauticae TaxID=2817027 RepID=UPI001CBB8FB4|nr:hypothetical protein [Phyllobacterium calauticae]MBZ3695556.1 hypothetical protein [Phyllobacterium calauticae]
MYSIDPQPYQANAWKYIGVVLFLAALSFGLGRYYAATRTAADAGVHRLNAEQQDKVTLQRVN